MGVLINGKYYKDPKDAPEHSQANIASQIQSYNIESAANKHDVELIQPYTVEGKPNPEFAKHYPELAKDYNMEELL